MTEAPGGAAAEVIAADVCVVGAGPAGLSLARSLLGTGLSVVVLEAGNDREPQFLTDLRVTGEDPYVQGPDHAGQTRAAFLGGTSGLWSYRMSNADPDGGARGCRYAPMDPIDFEARPEVPDGGWPITREDLDPWYAAAQPVCGLGRYDYTTEGWARPGREPLPLDHERIGASMFQFAPGTVWSVDSVAELRAGGVRIVTDAAVTGLETEAASAGDVRIAGVRFARPDGSRGRVSAARVVLAAGGIENSRLLLIGDGRSAIGNAHDQVGRYWMEHPLVRGGMLVAMPGSRLAAGLGLYDAVWQDGTKVMAKFTITEEWMRKEGLISTSALVIPRAAVHATAAVQAYTALRSPSGRAAGRGRRAVNVARMALGARDLLTARQVLPHQTGVDHNGWSERADAADWQVFELLHQTEQTPDADNRVTLTALRDRYGRRIPALHWRWTPADRHRVTRARDTYAEAFAHAGFGEVVQGDWEHGGPRFVGGNHHHMGGTRMSTDPRQGVVDADLKVHGTTNLHVAGSSVFPAGGSVNPTLTIVALSLRLGAHLAGLR